MEICRYETNSDPVRARVCHCRYCQLRSGSPFGIGAWFKEENVKILKGNFKKYKFVTESGNDFETNFCEKCGTSVYWTINADALKGMIAIGAGTFDPPAFWFDISGEIFTRSKAPFITIDVKIVLIDLKHLQLINQLKKTIIVLKVINN